MPPIRAAIRKGARIAMRVVMIIILIIILLPIILYIPPVQTLVKNVACDIVRDKTGMDIQVERLRVRFPLKVDLQGVTVIEKDAAPGDTMVRARSAAVDVAFWPLLRLDIRATGIDLSDVHYQLGTPDSLLYLTADVDRATVTDAQVDLKKGFIDASHARLSGARVNLDIREDTTATPPDTTHSMPWYIHASDIRLDSVTYTMTLEGVIDSIGAFIPSAVLDDGVVDMAQKRIHATYIQIEGVRAAYIYPAMSAPPISPPGGGATLALGSHVTTPTSLEAPPLGGGMGGAWTITADSLRLTADYALYALTGHARPLPGLDLDYLQATGITIAVDSFYNRGTAVTVPVADLQGTERCGLTVTGRGLFKMADERLNLTDFLITAGASQLNVTSAMLEVPEDVEGIGDFALRADARVYVSDVLKAYPDFAGLLKPMASAAPLTASADLAGSMARVDVRKFALSAFNSMTLNASGTVSTLDDPERLAGKITLDGRVTDGSLLTRFLPEGLRVPTMTLAGNVDYAPGAITGDLKGTANNGSLALDARWVARAESYDVDADLDAFPVDAFMPSLGVGPVTATVHAHGHGYNPMKATTQMDIDLDVRELTYKGREMSPLTLTATVADARATGSIDSYAPLADLTMDFDATLGDAYTWSLTGDIRQLDLTELHLMADTCSGSTSINTTGTYNPHTGDLDATLELSDLMWQYQSYTFAAAEASARVTTTAQSVEAHIVNTDFNLNLATRCGLDSLLAYADALPATLDSIMTRHRVDVESLQRSVPPMEVVLTMGQHNMAYRLIEDSGITFEHLQLSLRNDSLLSLDTRIADLTAGGTNLDSISISASQRGNTLIYNVDVNNAPGTLDNFAHVRLNGFVSDNRLSGYVDQHNLQGQQGFSFGILASMDSSVITARMVPTTPTIAYRKWTLNEDNYVSYDLADNRLHGDIHLTDGNSSLRLFTSGTGAEGDPEDLVANIQNLQISDYLALSPFAPPMSGLLSADIHFQYADEILTGKGYASLNNFTYDRRRVGDIGVGLDLATDPSTGFIKADAGVWIDSVKTMTFSGVVNDSTGTTPLDLDFEIIHLPLTVVNPFLPADVVKLGGTLDGQMCVTGTPVQPRFNGYVAFNKATATAVMARQEFTFDNAHIPVEDNVVRLDSFAIRGANENPLLINGLVDLGSLTDMSLDLTLEARNMQVINSTRGRGADVYGKGWINLDGRVHGNMRMMFVQADLTLLAGSNVTYVMATDASTALTNTSDADMVHFVQFADTAAVSAADVIETDEMALILSATVNVQNNTVINVDLSADGNNKVQLDGNGQLTYTMSPVNDGRLTGRYTISSGFVRYTPPLMSEKLFNFTEGSYVLFNGDMMNPTLSLSAVDEVKANVTRSGENSRLVNFDVSVSVTGTLENMNVEFDLSTRDDITVSNELASMSADQRASQAMNMLLYGVYQGNNGTSANSNIGGNMLYSFVESTLNNWMANNIKGVDISFGIDQYDKTYDGSTSTATNYSYHVSKTLFNDRFKIVVGGTYSTDNEGSDESVAETLFNDISAEYMLNKSGSMYVRIFRKTGYESILEGEVTQTGVGFVYRKRLNRLGDMFKFLRHLRRKNKDEGMRMAPVDETVTEE